MLDAVDIFLDNDFLGGGERDQATRADARMMRRDNRGARAVIRDGGAALREDMPWFVPTLSEELRLANFVREQRRLRTEPDEAYESFLDLQVGRSKID